MTPRWLTSRIRDQRLRRACGSRPVVGSSKITNSGLLTKLAATAKRWACPPESSEMRLPDLSVNPTCSSRAFGGVLLG